MTGVSILMSCHDTVLAAGRSHSCQNVPDTGMLQLGWWKD